MNILVIDTATEYLSLGLQSGDKRAYFLEKIGARHTEFALDKIQELVQQHGITVAKLDLIVYNQGPGSFTGLRVGLSLAIGLALGLDIKLVPIPAFMLQANYAKQQYALSGKVLVGLDARLNEIYLAGIDLNTWEYFLAPQIVKPAALDFVEGVIPLGNGFSAYREQLNPDWQKLLKQSKIDVEFYPNALNWLDLAKSGRYRAVNVEDADLLYLRDKIALNIAEQTKLRV